MASASPIDFAPLMGPVARRLLGEPNKAMSTAADMRFGTKGSVSIVAADGTFYDHEANAGGGVLDLIARQTGGDRASAVAWLEREGLIDRQRQQRPEPTFYDYADADGVIAYRVERRGKGMVPPFLQHGPDGRGGFHAAKGCMNGIARLPYRLPQLLAADPAAIVFVCEGEKDADRLARDGLVATTNSGGAGKFGGDLAPHFAGRRVVILADNDRAGEDHALDVGAKLRPVAAAVAIVRLGGTEKADVSDWLEAGGSAHQLVQQFAEPALAALAPAMLPLIDLAAWGERPAPDRRYLIDKWLMRGTGGLLVGEDGVGKSLLVQQMATCLALGLDFLGVPTVRVPSMYVTCEDDADELWRRQRAINAALNVRMDELRGKLHLVSLVGEIDNELGTFDQENRFTLSPRFRMIEETARSIGAGFIGLDNIAHQFPGNENVRRQVAAFCSAIDRLAIATDATVLMLGHPNKAGDEYSGTTGWSAHVRQRLYLDRVRDADGSVADEDARTLKRSKANHAKRGEAIEFRWHQWAFVRSQDLAPNVAAELSATIAATADNEAFLRCLGERNRQERPVSERFSRSYAPSVFAQMPESKGIGKARLEAAMDRLFRIGRIERGFVCRDQGKRRDVEGIREAPQTPAPNPAQTVPKPCNQPAPDYAPNPAPDTPLDTTYLSGAAHRAAAPVSENEDCDPFDPRGWEPEA